MFRQIINPKSYKTNSRRKLRLLLGLEIGLGVLLILFAFILIKIFFITKHAYEKAITFQPKLQLYAFL